jgi:hypothetical protein
MDTERQREQQRHPEACAVSASVPKTTENGPSEQVEDAARTARWGTLPKRVSPEDMVEEQPADPPNDPAFGRNPENDWLLRYTP